MNALITLLGLVAALTLGCGDTSVPPPPSDPQSVRPVPPPAPEQLEPATSLPQARHGMLRELDEARRLWRRTAPHEYRLTVSKECSCDRGTPFKAHIRGTVVVSGTGGERAGGIVEPELRTVESLFTEAERLIRSDAEAVTLVFDRRLGFPARISVDRWRSAVDDEWTWTAALTLVD